MYAHCPIPQSNVKIYNLFASLVSTGYWDENVVIYVRAMNQEGGIQRDMAIHCYARYEGQKPPIQIDLGTQDLEDFKDVPTILKWRVPYRLTRRVKYITLIGVPTRSFVYYDDIQIIREQ